MMHCQFLAGLAALTLVQVVHANEPELIFHIADDAKSCSDGAISKLFELSVDEARKESYSATNTEALSQANEEVFLACPEKFLRSLASADALTQGAVSYYFGVFEIELAHCALARFEGVQEFAKILPELQERSSSSVDCDQTQKNGEGERQRDSSR